VTPAALAALHGACFTTPRPWSAAEIAGLLASPLVFLLIAPQGFLLGRVVAGEAELLTLAVAPDARRQGVGGRLLGGFLTEAQVRGAESAFLEVAEANAAARALYAAAGFAQAGKRRGYYHAPDGTLQDALILVRTLTKPS
jgi:[ribosomal protein S18]-alanine N-acetyltransferase